METFKPFLKDLLVKSETKNNLFQRNLLKEYLQIVVLDFIYSHPVYGQLVFYGGSCLAHCFGLPRLSEDLDFVDLKKKVNIANLAQDLKIYFRNKTDLLVDTTTQKFRIYLKFPVLRELELSGSGETDLLVLKIEIFSEFNFCKNYETEIIPLFKFNRSLLVKTFDLPTLMATKIRALFFRQWVKTNKAGRDVIKVKGRDYFDLMWYLEKGIKPNLLCLDSARSQKELKNKLLVIISKLDSASIRLDLEALVDKKIFVNQLSRNMKEILAREIQKKL